MRALIIEAGYTTGALAATRALGQAGWTVGVGSPEPRGLASSSRWSRCWHRIPSPVNGLDEFVGATNRAIAEIGYDIVFGAGDAELLALSYSRSEIGATIPYASHEHVIRALDKHSLAEAAASVGLASPETVEASDDVLKRFKLPFVLKPRVHWLPGNMGAPSRLEACIVSNHVKAARRVGEIRACGGVPLVQEFIRGQLMGFTAVTDTDCAVVANLQQLAPLTWRPRNGMPARAHTVAVCEELAGKVAALLKELRWFGLVQLQFILPAGGEPRLIDFNGRAYASLALATAAGINFPDIWARAATGRKAQTVTAAALGVRYQWMEGDLRRSLLQRNGGLLRDVAGCIRYASGAVGAIRARDDPGPVFSYPWYLLRRAVRRARPFS